MKPTLKIKTGHGALACAALMLCAFLASCAPESERKASQIYVTTEPENANLFLDSAPYGSTPATISPITAGKHILFCRKAGYRETRATIMINPGDRLAVELKLEPLRGLVLVHSEPSGADVELEDINIGKTPLFNFDFPPGEHRLKITKPGFMPKTVSVNIEDRTPCKVEVSLTSDSADLSVDSKPAGAIVTMDGAAIGSTPLKLPDAKTGLHTLEVSLKGHLPFRREIDMKAGEKHKINAALTPLPGKLNVITAPPKARIYLNDQFKAESPYNATNIPSGQQVVRAELQGYDTQVKTCQVAFGETTTLEFRLEKSSGTMIITTLPPEVEVYLDGESRGATKARGSEQISEQLQLDYIPRGQHKLQFTKKGYIDIQRTVDIMPRQNLVIHEKLALRPVPFVPNVIIRTGDSPEQTFRGIIRDTFANGDIKVEIGPGVLKMFSQSEIISQEEIVPDGGQKK